MINAIKFNNKTDFLSEKLYNSHYKLYEAYVDKTNSITKKLTDEHIRKDSNSTYSEYRGLKKGETYALDGVILHELYFQNIGKHDHKPLGGTCKILEKHFGSVDNYLSDLEACAKSARGWAVFIYEQRTKTFRNILLDLHDYGSIVMGYPILVLDMYEHAYALDYGTDKNKYIQAFIKDIDWEVVEDRLKKI